MQSTVVSLICDNCILQLHIDQEMDGEAVSVALATHCGPDCLKDVLPKYGIRLKVYNMINRLMLIMFRQWYNTYVSVYTHVIYYYLCSPHLSVMVLTLMIM